MDAAVPEVIESVAVIESDAVIRSVMLDAANAPVTNEQEYEDALIAERNCKDRRDKLESERKRLKEPSLEAGRRIDNLFKPVIEAYDRAKRLFGEARMKYEDEKRRAAEEEARKAIRDAEDFAKLAVASAESGDEDGEFEAITAEAEVIKKSAEAASAVPSSGRRDNWSAECTDLAAIVRAAAAGDKMCMRMLCFDQKAANDIAKATKGAVDFPGVRFKNTQSAVTMSRRR